MSQIDRWFESRPERALTVGFFLVHCVIPMWIGGWIYLLFRAEHLLMFRWADAIGLLAPIQSLRADWGWMGASLPDWVLFSVPDGVWVYVATAFFGRLWRTGPLLPHLFWVSLASVLAIGGELAQYPGFIPGTFDWVDVICYTVAAASSYWFAAIR